MSKGNKNCKSDLLQSQYRKYFQTGTPTRGKSSFAALRAPDKLLTSELSRNVFVCKYHENLIYLLECLHQFDERFLQYNSSIPVTWVCSEESVECFFICCEDCKAGKPFQRYPFPQDVCAIDDGLDFVS